MIRSKLAVIVIVTIVLAAGAGFVVLKPSTPAGPGTGPGGQDNIPSGGQPASGSTLAWSPSESSHFGVDGFETVNHTLQSVSSAQLESNYQWEAQGIVSAGIGWNRTLSPMGGQFRWEDIEKNKGTYDWTVPDRFVRVVQEQGIQLLVLVHPYAAWDQPTKNNFNYNKPNDMDSFKTFITAMVERYDNDGTSDMTGLKYPIKYYEIGNEPEGPSFGDSPGTYNDFMDTVKAAYDAAKAAYPSVKIVIGGASPAYNTISTSMADTMLDNFWKGAFNRSNVSSYFDVFNFHFFVGQYTQDIKYYLDYWKGLLSAYGLSGKDIWLTETGT
ncbi:MAG: cellulase family glycosylhydrolase, partial [Candidatus Hadarchaeota archaeon]